MPYKLFSTGEVLTATNVNSYLMRQTVMVFADAASRTTALSGVLAEGMISYRTDAKVMELYNGTAWVDFTGDIVGVTAGTGLSGGGTSGTVTLSIDTATTVDKTTAQTLTNKTLTAPIISTISNTGTLTLPTSTDTLVGRATTDTLTNKTLTSAVVNTSSLKSPREITTVSATAATGTINFDANTQAVLYYTTNASANWTLNVRGDSGTTLNSVMATGDTLTVTFLVTQGSTAYYASAFTIDGTSVTPKWQGGTAPAAGNASSVDAYTYAIVKTGSAAYTVFASQTKFA
jgi:hypothetical protein